VREAWHVLEPGNPYLHGWHVDAICDHLEGVTRGDLSRLLINIPPGTMKSTLTAVFWPAWEWGPLGLGHLRYISASHAQDLATRDTLKMRRLIQSQWFQDRWPLELSIDQNQKTYFENKQTGFRQASAVASLTGKRGDRVIWDDPHSVEAAISDAHRETAIRVFQDTLPTRLTNPDRSSIIIVMQRLHEQDVSGHILSNDLGYEHLCLPMEYETKRPCSTSIGFKDPRTEDGELLFPERFPAEVVERDKNQMTEWAVAGQFQQRPSPLGGGIFRDDYWRYYRDMPRLKYRIIYGDTAQKTAEQNDYSVFECWGVTWDNQLVLVDLIRGKWEAPELLIQARAFWAKHQTADRQFGVLRSFKIEDKVSGTGLIQTLKREGVPVVAIQRDRDKYTRALDAVPTVAAGHVLLPESASWLSDFLAEAGAFPNGAFDDQVDPMLDAIADLREGARTNYAALL